MSTRPRSSVSLISGSRVCGGPGCADPCLGIVGSRRLREEFDNGEEYYRMHGRRLQVLPHREGERPAPEFIDWHNEHLLWAASG